MNRSKQKVALMTWLYWNLFVLLVGAEVTAETGEKERSWEDPSEVATCVRRYSEPHRLNDSVQNANCLSESGMVTPVHRYSS
jgi:uncharacterized BrkB/YihY/UPF0761 family membrane protein